MTLELPSPGQTVGGRYELFERLGEGGMAVVYRAHDRVDDRPVALKLLIPRYLGRPEREQRIVDEAEYLRLMQGQPGIVQLVAAGRLADHHDWPFLATELLAGRALQWVLIDRKFSRENLYTVAVQLAAALAACHAQGIVHRDVTPDNVFVDEATMQVKLFDFSHAGSLAAPRVPAGTHGRLTGIHDVPGTGGYMAPEQAMAAPAIAAMDVFAFGVLLHELITGRNPFPVSERSFFIQAQRLGGGMKVPRLDAWAYQLSEGWADLIEGCTASNASERPSMARVVALLEVIDDYASAPVDADSTQPIDAHVLEHLRKTAAPISDEPAATERLVAAEVARLQHGSAGMVTLDDAPTIVRRRHADSGGIGDWTRHAHGGSPAAAVAAPIREPEPEPATEVTMQPAFARKTAPPIVVLAPVEAVAEPLPRADAVLDRTEDPPASRKPVSAIVIAAVLVVGLGLGLFGLSRWFPTRETAPTDQETAAPLPTTQQDEQPLEDALPAEPFERAIPDLPSEPAEVAPEPKPKSVQPRERKDPPALSATDTGAEPEPARDPCRGVEDSGRAALRKLDWATVIKTTSKKKCWTSADERARLRVEALLQTRRWAECVEAADGFSDPKIVRWSQFCAKHL